MKLDFKSLAFGYSLTNGVSTPAWETSLGQGFGYKLNNLDTIDELVKGMVYKAVAPKTVSFKKGRGGATVQGDADNASLVISAVFDKVFVNDQQIHGGQFVLLIVKDDAESHKGRLKLKYGLDNTYTNSEGVVTKNRDFHTMATQQLGLANDACWFVYDMSVENQDILRLRTIIVNKDGPMTYVNNTALHSAWDELIKTDMETSGISDESEETSGDIFSGFQPWLTSYDNPDYTGKQKYSWYPQALLRLINFMEEKGLIDDANLNDKNIEKYYFYLDVYNLSDEVREYDEKKLSSKAGGTALKKYIKYIEFLLSPHAEEFDYSSTMGTGESRIFFGTPGCGKSYHIEHDILGKDKITKEYKGEFLKENIIRTTFYQDYSYTDFVGQILPKIVKGDEGEKDTVEYIFNPGPFTLALIQAISNPTKKVALVVEEINRGNAPAIFGDIFQLLDRDENNVSEYGIVNVSMIDYLNDYTFVVDGTKKTYKFTEIKIPANLYIYATMNTSDQNVYTLDTAFVRRWEREKIKNSFAKCSFKAKKVPGMDYTWQEFVEAINICIASHLEDLQVNEDKQIGAFFVKEALLSGSAEKFAYKVFDYLWNDVAKLDHGIFFNPYNTLDTLIAAYVDKGVAVFKPGVFKEKASTPTQSEASDE